MGNLITEYNWVSGSNYMGTFRQHDGFSATVIDQFTLTWGNTGSGYSSATNIAFDNSDLYAHVYPVQAQSKNYIRRYAGFSNSQTGQIDLGFYRSTRITSDPDNGYIYGKQGTNGQKWLNLSPQGSYAGGGGSTHQPGHDGTNLLSVDSATGIIYQYDGETHTVLDQFVHPHWVSGDQIYIVHDGASLYSILNGVTNKIYRHSGFSDVIIQEFLRGGSANMLPAWQGNALPLPPDTDFSATPLIGFPPLPVTFTNLTTGALTYSWSLPGGTPNSSTDQDPSVEYGTPGTYDVTLAATNDGGTTQEVKAGYITIHPPPTHTVTVQYKEAGGTFAEVTGALGDVGTVVGTYSKIAYWEDPFQDRADVEIGNGRVKIEAIPDSGNLQIHNINVTNVTQLSTGDGTGNQGDVKIEYEILT